MAASQLITRELTGRTTGSLDICFSGKNLSLINLPQDLIRLVSLRLVCGFAAVQMSNGILRA